MIQQKLLCAGEFYFSGWVWLVLKPTCHSFRKRYICIEQKKEEASMRNLLTPIISMGILTLGNGFFTTLTTIELHQHNWSNFLIGCVAAMYFLGLTIGALYSGRLVNRVGHIRAYAAYAAVMAIATLLQGMVVSVALWCVLRFITGYVLAGLFIVIESWVLDASQSGKKTSGFAVYLFAYYLAQSAGQLMLGIHYSSLLFEFVVIAILITASIIPVSATRMVVPLPKKTRLGSLYYLWRRAPLAVVGSIVTGICLGSAYSIYPLFLSESGLSKVDISWVMMTLILGGTLLQYPIGWLSDHFDRRYVIIGVSWFTVLISLVMIFAHQYFSILLVWTFLLGGALFTLYPVCIGNASDALPKSMSLPLIALLTFVYGLGNFVGPLFTTASMHLFGANGFFYLIAFVCLLMGLYTLWRKFKVKERLHYSHFVGTVVGKPVDTQEILGSDVTGEQQEP